MLGRIKALLRETRRPSASPGFSLLCVNGLCSFERVAFAFPRAKVGDAEKRAPRILSDDRGSIPRSPAG